MDSAGVAREWVGQWRAVPEPPGGGGVHGPICGAYRDRTPMQTIVAGTGAARRVILVAEDEWLVRQALAESLHDAGHAVMEVSNGREAVALLHGGGPIDLVVTDMRMPGEPDGLGVLACARQMRPLAPVIVTSGHLDEAHALAAGADACLGKPYDMERLVRLVGVCLARGPRPRRPVRWDRVC